MPTLVITAEFSDESDFDFYRTRMVGAVEDIAVEAQEDDGAADGTIEVGWDVED